MTSSPVAVYVHTPFCPSKCGYCDFNSYAMDGEIVERTVRATVREISESPWRGRPAKTVFFGGGTPTFLSAGQIVAILRAVVESHPPVNGAEITSEANPGTADAEKFAAMRGAGFNRLSLGAQSFKASELLQLGRVHQASDIARAVGVARNAGFKNLNLDLMFALPGQCTRVWEENLSTAVSLKPEHLSLYCLTIEPNTRFYRYYHRGVLDLPDEDAQVAMYDQACFFAAQHGYEQYEISNFAKPGFQSEHNLCYWRGEEYIGYGPGAVGCVASENGTRHRYTVTKHPVGYCDAVESGKGHFCEEEDLDAHDIAFEKVMMGIRLNDGLSLNGLVHDVHGLSKVVSRGWAEVDTDQVRLTGAGRHFCSEVVSLLAP